MQFEQFERTDTWKILQSKKKKKKKKKKITKKKKKKKKKKNKKKNSKKKKISNIFLPTTHDTLPNSTTGDFNSIAFENSENLGIPL